jgi:subtilisin family serine protease
MTTITINGNSLDPLSQTTELHELGLDSVDVSDSDYSSRGPTRDHRIKPDVVAPGSTILSAKSRLATANPRWGPSPDGDYMFDAGTSMATPLVAGCAAVVRESFRVRRGVQPSAALVKAMLVNGASSSGPTFRVKLFRMTWI